MISNLYSILREKYQGLPGLGVDGSAGIIGNKGKSIYIGHIKDFFNVRKLTDDEYLYFRVKDNEQGYYSKGRDDSSSYNTYKNDNFYQAIKDEINNITSFSIYPIKYVDGELFNNYYKSDPSTGVVVSKDKTEVNDVKSLDLFLQNIHKARIDPKYLEERAINNSQTNYSNNYTDDIAIPTTLKSMYTIGDILYLLDDYDNQIISYVIISEDMLECSFDYFKGIAFNFISEIVSSININQNRVQVNRPLNISRFIVPKKLIDEYDDFYNNYLDQENDLYLLSLNSNESNDTSYLNIKVPNNSLNIDYLNNDSIFKFNISTRSRISNLYLNKDIWSNINIPIYYTDNVIFDINNNISKITDNDISDSASNLKITKLAKDYFYNEDPDKFFKLEIYKKNEFDIYEKIFSKAESASSLNNSIEYIIDSKGNYLCICSVYGYGICKYISKADKVKVYYTNNILSYTIEDNDIDNSVDGDFVGSNISPEANKDYTLSFIADSSDIIIKNIYLNNQEIPLTGSISKDFNNQSWYHYKSLNLDSSSSFKLSLDIEENLPNLDNNKKISSYNDLLDALQDTSGNINIDTKISETSSRKVPVTVILQKNGILSKKVYNIIQDGMINPLYDISIGLENVYKGTSLEDSNNSRNGLLCNQIQSFTRVNIDNFNANTWGSILEDVSMAISLDLEHKVFYSSNDNISTKTKSAGYEQTNANNIHVYSKNDIALFKDNAVKASFGYIDDSSISYDSKVKDINNKEIYFDSSYYIDPLNTDAMYNNDWIRLDNPLLLSSKNSNIPYDINYQLNNAKISGITIDRANNTNKLLLRGLFEVANPIPMEFNIRWKVTRIDITGSYNGKLYHFYKDLDINKNSLIMDLKNGIYSDNIRFIINPINLTLANESSENIANISGSLIKRTGSTDNVKLTVSIEDIDSQIYDDYQKYNYDDEGKKYRLYNSKGNYDENENGTPYLDYTQTNYKISDITYYYPKKKYFQDNIQNIGISVRHWIDDINNGILDSSYIENINFFKENEDTLRTNDEIYAIDISNSLNKEYENDLIEVIYNADIMNPILRQSNNTFYYNNILYNADNYDQWNKNSPLWENSDTLVNIVDSSLVTSKQIWNYEYEANPNNTKGIGGNITKSGYGYLYADSTIDIGQYNKQEAYSLAETKKLSNEYILDHDSKDVSLNIVKGYKSAPNTNDFFRSMVYDLNWNYPYFLNIDNQLKVYPYTLTNSYISKIDLEINKEYIDSSYNSIKKFINSKKDIDEEYYKIKISKDGYNYDSENNKYVDFKNDKANALIPYNILFDLYPRTAYNSDSKGITFNILMLKQPTISNNISFKLQKRYFDNDIKSTIINGALNFNK